MNFVKGVLPKANVAVDVEVSSKKRLFEYLALIFENHHGIARGLAFESLFARERLGSTGLGNGAAIPHGRIKGLKEPIGALVRLSTSLPFDSFDAKPVGLVFCLLVPEQATEKHLLILSTLAHMFSDPEVHLSMAAVRDSAGLHQLVSTWTPNATGQRHAIA